MGFVFFVTNAPTYPPGIVEQRIMRKTIPIFLPERFTTSFRNVTAISTNAPLPAVQGSVSYTDVSIRLDAGGK